MLLITKPLAANAEKPVFIVHPDTNRVQTDSLPDESIDAQIKYSARDSIRYEADGQKIYLFGGAVVEYEGTTLKADLMEIDNRKNLITAEGVPDSTGKRSGNPEFTDAENEMRAEKIIYSTKTKKGKIYGVLTKQAEMLVYGEAIKKDTNNVLYIKNAKCIPCEYEDARIYFRATKAKVIPDDKVITGPIFVEVSGIKTPLGLPFGFFPNVKNKSKMGVLIPYFGQSPNQGFFLQNGGFYLPLGNKLDMTVTGDIYSVGSWALRTSNNYNMRYKFNGNLNLEFKQINLGQKEIPYLTGIPPVINANGFQKLKTFSVSWIHTQDTKSKPNERFSANVHVQSGLNNKYNPQSISQVMANTFYSNVNFSHTFKNSALSVNARHNQNTLNRQMEISFPELTFNVNRFFPFKNELHSRQTILDKLGINYIIEAKSYLRETDSLFFREKSLDNIQHAVRQNLPISTNFNLLKYFTVTPSANFSSFTYYKNTSYHYEESLNKAVMDTTTGFKTGVDANFSANISTKLFGDYYFKTKRLKQIRHFIIPTAGFTYHPDMTNPKYGYYRNVMNDSLSQLTTQYSIFQNGSYGGPSGAEAGLVTLNLNNNFEAKVRQRTDSGYTFKKIVLLQNLSINANYNLAATDYKWSMIAVTGRTRVWKNIDLLGSGTFDPYALDSTGKRSPLTEYKTNGTISRFVGATFALNSNFNPQLFAKPGKQANGTWNLNIGYNLAFARPDVKSSESITQAVTFNGNLDVTKNWKVMVTSGYDIKSKSITLTSFNIRRDLRCWEANLEWVPFGFYKRYMVSVNLKMSAFSSVKIPRTRQWYDNL
ncbi:MAG: putative LPS assembly protein LptD [Bacteroidia bacterium]